MRRKRSSFPNKLTSLLAANDEDDGLPRIPPPPATPLDFPSCSPQAKSPGDLEHYDLVKLFSNILRTGPSQKHLESLNVNLENDVPLESLVPVAYLPQPTWLQDPAKVQATQSLPNTTPPNETLSNGGPLPGHEVFYIRARELMHENEEAFRTVKRKPARPGLNTARVLHFRRFWESLSAMADYWDTSLDNYSKTSGSQTPVAIDVDVLRSEVQGSNSPPNSEAQSEETYTGRRKDTGKKMPPTYREETIFAFVEPIAWSFRCRLEHPRMQPKLKIQGMILPLPHNLNIYRTPKDSRQARRGILEGPLAGVFCREQTTFRRAEDSKGQGKHEILDLLKEVGLALMLAQKRAREGKEEEPPGNGQWWATKPRWGGGPGGEVGISEEDAKEEVTTSEGSHRVPKKLDRAAMWKEMKPPMATWEKGVKYIKIGGARESDHDDIYLFSSVNHHISIVHLRIHNEYIEHLPKKQRRGSGFVPSQQPWYRLTMKRSAWFDLLVADDRIEAMRGIWAVLGWLMRDNEGPDKPDAEMT